MKQIITILTLLLCAITNAQQFRISESQKKEVVKLDKSSLTYILLIEGTLNSNNKLLDDKETSISNPSFAMLNNTLSNLNDKDKKKFESLICISCYEDEWKQQQDVKALIKEKELVVRDSIVKQKELVRQQQLEVVQEKKEVVVKEEVKDPLNEGYQKLRLSLFGTSKNRNFTVFRGIDHNYAGTTFSTFLQLDMRLSFYDFKEVKNKYIEKYVPKVSSNENEYLTVTYFITPKLDVYGAYGEGAAVITKVEMVGTPTLLSNIFLKYWPKKIHIDSSKKGIIAYQQVLGDYVVIENMQSGLFKITISKGNMDVDYESTFGIHQKI